MELLVVNGVLLKEDNNMSLGEKPLYQGFQVKMCKQDTYRCTKGSVGMQPQSEGSRL